MNISNILPSIQYDAGTGSQNYIAVQPTRIKSAVSLNMKKKSKYDRQLLNATLLQSNSGITINSGNQETFSIGGVKVLSRKFSHTSNANKQPISPQVLRHSNEFSHLSSQRKTYQVYQSKPGSPNLSIKRENSASSLSRINLNNRSKQKSNTNSSSVVNNLHKGRASIPHKHHRIEKNRTGKNITHRLSVDENKIGKPEFTTSNAKAIKVFLSQKQSADISVTEKSSTQSLHPSAPPCTPSLEMLKKYDYVPSLSDNMAKQQIKAKLKIMKKVESDKERIKQAEKLKVEAKEAKEREQELRKQQRRIIYLLNDAMTKAENEQFENFKANVGLKPKEYPSHSSKRR